MNKKTKAGIGAGLLAISGGIYSLLRPAEPTPQHPQIVSVASPSPIVEAEPEPPVTASPVVKPKSSARLQSLTSAAAETEPECNAVFESTGPIVNGSDYSAQFKWTHGPPTNAPCWKDLYVAAIGSDVNSLTWVSADRATGLAAEDHVRVRFVSPSPSPTPVILPVCRSGERIGNPATCRCLTGLQGNSGKCR